MNKNKDINSFQLILNLIRIYWFIATFSLSPINIASTLLVKNHCYPLKRNLRDVFHHPMKIEDIVVDRLLSAGIVPLRGSLRERHRSVLNRSP